jgi:CRP/FNR family transcriptional regulator, cyclic AMP receptor protein
MTELTDSEIIEILLRYFHMRRYPNHTVVIKPGDSNDLLYYINQGSVSVKLPNLFNSDYLILDYLNKGEFIGETNVFIEAKPTSARNVLITTKEASQLCEIEYKRFQILLEGDLKEYAVRILKILGRQVSRRLYTTDRKVESLAFYDVTGRMANVLMDLCRKPEAMTHPDGMQIKVTRQELAAHVGCSREMAGKVLITLQEHGLIHAHGKTIVVFGRY